MVWQPPPCLRTDLDCRNLEGLLLCDQNEICFERERERYYKW